VVVSTVRKERKASPGAQVASLKRVPFHIDLLDADLDERIPNFAEGQPIHWGLAVAAIPGGWQQPARLRGVDWEIRLYPPGQFKVPGRRRAGSERTGWRTVPQHCALLMVHTKGVTINAARDDGRPAVQSLLALARREIPLLLPSEVLWEGGIAQTRRGRLRMTMSRMEMRTKDIPDPTRLHRSGLRLAPVSVLAMPHQVSRALQWLALARSARVRPEKFIHLWLAVRAIADYGQPNKGHQMTRIGKYTATMAFGVGGVLSRSRIEALNRRLHSAYSARTALLHKDDDSQITPDLLDDLEAAAFQLVDFELAKVSASVSHDAH
jgi:hypothetical protein